MKFLGFNNSPFNIEFFYDQEQDRIYILEINPRMSQSHSYLYAQVKGRSNHQVLINLALGEKPQIRHKTGPDNYAGKFQYRFFHDGIVERTPGRREILELEQQYPNAKIHVTVQEGDKLSEMKISDAYSYDVAEIFLAATTKEKLFDTYNEVKDKLDIRVKQ